VQRDLYSAFLAAFLDPAHPLPSCAQYVVPWEGAEARLRAAHERVIQRANEGQVVPRRCAALALAMLPLCRVGRLRARTSRTPNLPGAERRRGKEHVGKAGKPEGMEGRVVCKSCAHGET
jgi:hypothetical protein